jgi:quinoprotein glucose dehydrogenase
VDLKTGERRWHFQLVHHGLWDMDIPCAPILVDITMNGRTIKAVAQPTKQAFLYVFDRATGEPIWPIEERPVPQGEVPGEKYSPTQPFPTRPAPYDRQGLAIDDLIDFTPELRAEAIKAIEPYQIGPIFTPPVASAEGTIATLQLGSQGAATNWPGGSYDPETHILYVYSQSQVATLGLVPPPEGVAPDVRYHQGTVLTGARRSGGSGSAGAPAGGAVTAPTVQGLPLIKPPYGRISAIDLNTGDIAWQVAHGETPDAIKNNPALKGVTIPRTGRPGGAGGSSGGIGTLVTRTLVISGEGGTVAMPDGSRGAMLRAYDKKTGAELGAVAMPGAQTGSPMTYMLNGKQYIVVATSSSIKPGELTAYKLP